MFPCEKVDDLWDTKSKGVGLTVCAISFQDFQPMWSQSTNVTDGQTDDMRLQDHAITMNDTLHRHYAKRENVFVVLFPRVIQANFQLLLLIYFCTSLW